MAYLGMLATGAEPKQVPNISPQSSKVYFVDPADLGQDRRVPHKRKAEFAKKPNSIPGPSVTPQKSSLERMVQDERTPRLIQPRSYADADSIIREYRKNPNRFVKDFADTVRSNLPGEKDLEGYLKDISGKEGIPFPLMKAMFVQESGFRQRDKNGRLITSHQDAEGIAQLLPGTAIQVNRIVFQSKGSPDSPIYSEIERVMGRYGAILPALYRAKWKGDKEAAKVIDALERKDLDLSRERADYNLLKGMAYFRHCLRPGDGRTVYAKDHAKAMAGYHSGPGEVERAGGIPIKPNALKYVAVMNRVLPEEYGLYFVPPKDNVYRISKNTGLPKQELLSLNPGLSDRIYNTHSFPIRLADDADPDKPLYSLKSDRNL